MAQPPSSPRTPPTSGARTHPLAALALVLASLAACLVAIELAFVPLLHHLPRKLHVYLDPALRPLASSSKRAALPRDYVALVGDSYAQGRGDWLLESDANANGPYASAHVLFERSGRDVISWGRGGAGFVSGWVAFPVLSWRALQSSRRTALAPPALLIAFFYEGNDLEDTLLELALLSVFGDPATPGADPNERLKRMSADEIRARVIADPNLRDPARFEALVRQHFLPHMHEKIGAPRDGWRPALFFPRFLASLAAGEIQALRGLAPRWEWEGRGYFGENRVRLPDRVETVPGGLQSPGMEMAPEDIELSLRTADLAFGLLAASFPDSALCLLRVPSPASLYEFDGSLVSVQGMRGTPGAPMPEIRRRSDELGARVEALAARHGARYVDALPALRDAARGELIHGPRDWRHLNRRGQTVLGEVATQCLAAPAPARRAADGASR